MEIDTHRFLNKLKGALFSSEDPQCFVADHEVSEIKVEHYSERMEHPTHARTGKPLKNSTMEQYKSMLDTALKEKNEAKLLILICRELGLLKELRTVSRTLALALHTKSHRPHSFRRSSAKLKIVHSEGMAHDPEPIVSGISEPWLYKPVI